MNRRQGFALAAGLAVVLGSGIALARSDVPILAGEDGAGPAAGGGGFLPVNMGGSPNLASGGGGGGGGGNCAVPVSVTIGAGTTDLMPFLIASRTWKVKAIYSVVSNAAGASLTATVLKVPAGTASSAGTALTTGAINLDAVSTTPVAGTLVATAGVTTLAATDRLVLDLTDVVAAAVGAVTVCLAP